MRFLRIIGLLLIVTGASIFTLGLMVRFLMLGALARAGAAVASEDHARQYVAIALGLGLLVSGLALRNRK
jgi:hypothetical protein